MLQKGERTIDELCEALPYSPGEINSCLTDMAFSGIMKQLPGRVCLVGDTPFDVAAGRALGIPVIGVATGGRFGVEDLRKAGATLTVADYSDLDGLLDWLGETLK